MAWNDFLAAFALYLVIEGLFPFANPKGWRKSFFIIAQLSNIQLRVFGAAIIVMGLILLLAMRG